MSAFVPIHYPGVEISGRLTFSPAVRCGRLVWISGLTATDDSMKLVGEGDIAEQTRAILNKMRRLLESVGGSLADIVETTEYVTTFEGYEKTAAVRREMLRGPPWPAATGVLVAGLIRKGALIEIKATAMLARDPDAGA
ncbi:MAG: RidA family protein [Reyranellaceae bacterium]